MDWDGPTSYPPLPKDLFILTMESFSVVIEQAKRAAQGVRELQRGALITWLEIPESDRWIPPMSIRSCCERLDIGLEEFYAKAQRLQRKGQ